MKRVNVDSHHGVWYYKKVMPNAYNDYDETVWVLYDVDKKLFSEYGYRWELLEWVETYGNAWRIQYEK